jgi:hypothetical protein
VIAAVPTLALVGYFWWEFLVRETQKLRGQDWFLLVTFTIGTSVILPVMLNVIVAWLFSPVLVVSYKNDHRLFLTFRNTDYHRIARQWMAGGRTAAMAPDGFPVPPRALKAERAQTNASKDSG